MSEVTIQAKIYVRMTLVGGEKLLTALGIEERIEQLSESGLLDLIRKTKTMARQTYNLRNMDVTHYSVMACNLINSVVVNELASETN